ncbi:3-oxoacyl-ACP synthase III family protein [Geofilum rubicundum]|uniref:3-oxoacyl-[acyl-carrier-protein] synthase, KASIII n=1 Tax=Geofilum rubicundum JCM 15548 TaxID=1236989 RepID=A0A0E9M2P0_9BACT|nr:ketoacyl-ACP synthase III [Geofilum rubicundum]GAO31661.1 3-oxoacyl-[acyl-carrier-protein] synthase, KASIII [Geofilum rubicundum JCM 15548]
MAFLEFNHVGIAGLSGAVPRTVIDNLQYTSFFSPDEARDIVAKTGIHQRRFADADTCASDLCYAAAERLLTDMQVDRSEIDLLIFVSQTADYRMPSTSVLLQHRLSLSKQTMALDINIGCSGFIYGLSVVYALMQQGSFRKALLLDGETRSKVYSPKDRKTAFLFGDGGVAALIVKNAAYRQSFFSMNTDGSRESLIKIEGGGYRHPSSVETVQERVVDADGNIRSMEQGYMNGADVFNFLISEIPKDIKRLLEKTGAEMEGFDYVLFHQANDYMNDYLIKKLKLNRDKVPSSIRKFGNTSSVSIPLTIVSELSDQLHSRKKVLLSGFGVGMSWASAIMDLVDCYIPPLVEI